MVFCMSGLMRLSEGAVNWHVTSSAVGKTVDPNRLKSTPSYAKQYRSREDLDAKSQRDL